MSWIKSDVVSSLASMRITFFVCSSGQSNWSGLMVFSSSVPTANSWGVFWIRLNFMIIFSILNKFLYGYFDRLYEFMRDNEGSWFFIIEGLRDGTSYIHLGNWVVVAEDAVEVSIFNSICEIKKEWWCVLWINKLKTVVGLSWWCV